MFCETSIDERHACRREFERVDASDERGGGRVDLDDRDSVMGVGATESPVLEGKRCQIRREKSLYVRLTCADAYSVPSSPCCQE